MRARAVAAFLVLIGSGIGAVTAAGSASAAEPVPALPGVIAGLRLDHSETVAVANSPIPSLLGIGLFAPIVSVSVPEGSPTPRSEDGAIAASMPTIWADMAAVPNGRITVALVDPVRFGGKVVIVKQVVE